MTFDELKKSIEGDLFDDALHKSIYATDASVYRMIPKAVTFPKSIQDIKKIIDFARRNKTSIIPRTAGTSLAGQCVGEGIVVDVSKYLTKIESLDLENKQVTVQPGVIRDELNTYLKPFGLFFGPNTSTSNRCMIGGMVGNNSSGTTSIQYGVTRDKIVSMKTLLANGEEVVFEKETNNSYQNISNSNSKKGAIYKDLYQLLNNEDVIQEIRKEFPKSEIHRRNTGYAIDELINTSIFNNTERPLNFCDLLCGSEGTLAFTTSITLQLDELPPAESAMIITHYKSLEDCLNDIANVMQENLFTCEMMDKIILDCTKNNKEQRHNRFFVSGDPAALLMLEVRANSNDELKNRIASLISRIESTSLSYSHPVLSGFQIEQAMELRKAGLGLLGNMIGDRKAVACIEDTAVALDDLANFIQEFTAIMDSYNQQAVYYAHAGAGELHLRPILDLKKSEDVKLFRTITTDVAKLTKKYNGSFSGEHGDGIVRAEFIPLMIGERNYEILKQVKQIFDPENIFNPGKIVDSYQMDQALRYEVDREEPKVSTIMDFSDSQGILRAAEKCNGSGDCRKTEKSKGAMCPSYHATKNEKDTTRARANLLREVLTTNSANNKFDKEELKEVFDLCLSCKACASECPSNVDVAVLKAEFSYQYQREHGYSRRAKLFAHSTKHNKLASRFPRVSNFLFSNTLSSSLIKTIGGIASERPLPKVAKSSATRYLKKHPAKTLSKPIKKVILFIDEFINYMESEIAIDAISLLNRLNYDVLVIDYLESGRSFISKGFLDEAKVLADQNLSVLKEIVTDETVMIGLEPSAILTFRDEYLRLAEDKTLAKQISSNTYLIEEFLANEIQLGNISSGQFTGEKKKIKIHNHCHQKALSNQKVTFDLLNLPTNYEVTIINSGCCGMAGSFGYEKEHYDTSMAVAETKLFPALRKANTDTIIVANGTSCRHQIKDGLNLKSFHPVQVMLDALN